MEPSRAQIRRSNRFRRLQAAVFECIVFDKFIVETASKHDVSPWSLRRCTQAIKLGRVENVRATMPGTVDQSPDPSRPDLVPNAPSDSDSDSDLPDLVPNIPSHFVPNIPSDFEAPEPMYRPDPAIVAFINNLNRHLQEQQQRDLGDFNS